MLWRAPPSFTSYKSIFKSKFLDPKIPYCFHNITESDMWYGRWAFGLRIRELFKVTAYHRRVYGLESWLYSWFLLSVVQLNPQLNRQKLGNNLGLRRSFLWSSFPKISGSQDIFMIFLYTHTNYAIICIFLFLSINFF